MDDLAIKAENVSKLFKLPHEKQTSIKSLIVNFYRRKKTYELQQALKDISFEIKKGDFFGIVGRNGSGKSTMLKLLAGIYTPSQGEIHVRGKLTPFIELGVGFNPELTGRENVYLNGALLGFNRKEMEAMYDDIVEFAEIENFMDQKLKNYSSGMQVRLAFSIAIRAKSDILLLDEVLAVGDAAFQQKCYNYFEELKEQKQTVVFVSHDMGAIRRFCTRAVYIDKGILTHEGTPNELADIYIADNIENERLDNKSAAKLPNKYKVRNKITKQSDDDLVFEISYESKSDEELYVGISILKDGVSVAEITTSPGMKLAGKGKVSYALDKNLFNGGAYQITVVLCRLKNRQLLSIGNKLRFTVKGSDPTKGAALKLANTWEREN
jgi:ABC-2 type transport system ATP-binding protein